MEFNSESLFTSLCGQATGYEELRMSEILTS